MTCDQAQELLGPYFDEELDLVKSLEVDGHVRGCPGCSAALDRYQALRSAIRAQAPYFAASPELRKRIRALQAAPRSTWNLPAWALAAAAVVMAAFGLWRFAPARGPAVEQELLSAHVRSLQANHLMDVPSTDRHTVKPWFAGKLDFAPDVQDLSAKGFTLEGGRLDYVGGRPVAALVYKRRLHTINVFQWPAAGEQSVKVESHNGFNVAHWKHGGIESWAVSDLSGPELAEMGR